MRGTPRKGTPQLIEAATYRYGWLSKSWSPFGSLKILGAGTMLRTQKRVHHFDSHIHTCMQHTACFGPPASASAIASLPLRLEPVSAEPWRRCRPTRFVETGLRLPRPPNVPLSRALWSLLIRCYLGCLKGHWAGAGMAC